MSKLSISLSYKNACILKHALRDKIKEKEDRLFQDRLVTMWNMSQEEKLNMGKELEEEKRALEAITEEIKQCGFMHNKQVFG
jgi:hypothetical protein